MKIQIITNATYGHRVGGRLYPKVKTDAPFDVTDAEARRLVAAGVAMYAGGVSHAVESGGKDESERDENRAGSEQTGAAGIGGTEGDRETAECPAYSEDMPLDELKAVYKHYGLTYRFGMKKSAMVSELDALLAGEGADGGETNETEGDETPPEPSAEEPQR